MRQRDDDLAMYMLQALDDPAAVITLSIMRYRGMPPEMAVLEQPVLDFISEHFETAADGIWHLKPRPVTARWRLVGDLSRLAVR